MHIPKKGFIAITDTVETTIDPDYIKGSMSYFTPNINPERGGYQPPSSFAMGVSCMVDYAINYGANQIDVVYDPLTFNFGADFRLPVKFRYIGAYTGGITYDNAQVLLDYYYARNTDAVVNDSYMSHVTDPVFLIDSSPFITSDINLSKKPNINIFGLRVTEITPPDNYEIPLTKVRGACNEKNLVPQFIETDVPPDLVEQTGYIWLSRDPAKAANGIFEGEILIYIPATSKRIESSWSTTPSGEVYCNDGNVVQTKKEMIQILVKVETTASIKIVQPDLARLYRYVNGEPSYMTMHNRTAAPIDPQPSLNNINYFCEYDKSNDLTRFIYRGGNMQTGQTPKNLYGIYVEEIYQGATLISRQYYATQFFKLINSVYEEPFNNATNPKGFATFIHDTVGVTPSSWGIEIINNKYVINGFNFNDNMYGQFYIDGAPATGAQVSLYSFNDGTYTAFYDHITNKLFFILNDASGYFSCSLNDFLPNGRYISNFIKLNSKQFLLGTNNYFGLNDVKYFTLDFNLIVDIARPTKIEYELNKIAVTFIPCHTHCMGKGGIISKV